MHDRIDVGVFAEDSCILVEGPSLAHLHIILATNSSIDGALNALCRLGDEVDHAADRLDNCAQHTLAYTLEKAAYTFLFCALHWLSDDAADA